MAAGTYSHASGMHGCAWCAHYGAVNIRGTAMASEYEYVVISGDADNDRLVIGPFKSMCKALDWAASPQSGDYDRPLLVTRLYGPNGPAN